MTANDRELERERYDARARTLSQLGASGAAAVRLALRAPYEQYEHWISAQIKPGQRVLEIGAGTGEFSGVVLQTTAELVASDISEFSLRALARRHDSRLLTVCMANMERLPFGDASFDAVISAGTLSYGDSQLVRDEIVRVLRPGGRFICVDSLNHNPIYRLNRRIHVWRGRRTISTVRRMPDLSAVEGYRRVFETVEVRYFGAAAWLAPIVAWLFGEAASRRFQDKLDGWINVYRSAFKFVMLATKAGSTLTGRI